MDGNLGFEVVRLIGNGKEIIYLPFLVAIHLINVRQTKLKITISSVRHHK
jgi:hypothetical protein